MTKFIDLTHQVTDDMPVYPEDDPVELYKTGSLEEDGYNYFRLETGLHAGTHIDTPMHMTKDDTYMNEIPLERFTGNGCILDVRNQSPIEYKDEYSEIVKENDIVLLHTGFDEKYGSKEYYTEHPIVDESLAKFFVDKKIKMLGMDIPTPDKYPFNIHKTLFKNGILIIENLTNLSELSDVEDFEIIAFPLKIKADSSIARVVAKV
ncbi:MAG: cyclase family protein [Thermoplasmatota archaeon]